MRLLAAAVGRDSWRLTAHGLGEHLAEWGLGSVSETADGDASSA